LRPVLGVVQRQVGFLQQLVGVAASIGQTAMPMLALILARARRS
jgi:hypothetical protein